ncbi:MAG: hypothetical protein NDI69_02980 [Bacteriovoracaceae bacterium]|nr:hypothetical protein [Bacteriovoracaceae bacterium]
MRTLIALFIFLLTTSCGFEVTSNNLTNSKILTKIFGSVPSLVGSITHQSKNSFYAYAATCEATVELLELDANDKVISPAVASAPVMPDGSFTLSADPNVFAEPNVKYILEVTTVGACDELLQRPLTSPSTPQVVTAFSTIVSFARESELSKKLTEVTKEQIEKLLSGTSTIVSADEAYTILSTSKAQEFSVVFSDNPAKLNEATPVIKEKVIPANQINEGAVNNYKITAYHWNPNYNVAIQWKLDGALVSSLSGWNYAPGGDSSGPKSLEIYVGADNGAGGVDLTRPYHYLTHSFAVNNSILPSPPALNFASTLVADPDITVNMLTGPGMVNCQTFDSLAITVDDATVPLFFLQDCDTANSQTLDLSLPAGDGTKIIRLWARDHEGVISPMPSQLSVTLDQTGPEINLTSPQSVLRGGQSINTTLAVSDLHGVANLNLYISTDNGLTYNHVTSILTTATSHNWSTPVINSTSVKIKLVAQDSLGNSSAVESDSFAIDSTAPLAPAITLTSPSITNNLTTTLSLPSCSDYSGIHLSESSTAPAVSDAGWVSCQNSLSYTLTSATNGIRRIYAFAKDAVGNISSSNYVELTLDTAVPDVTLLGLDSSTPTNNSTISISASSCSGMSHVLIKNTNSAPSINDSGWNACSSVPGNITANISGGSAHYSFYAFAKDAAGNISSSKVFNITYDITPPVLSSVIINPTSADPSIGDEYTGTVFVNVKINYQETESGSAIKLSLADPATGACVQDSSSWLTQLGTGDITQTLGFQINSGDGTKKICAWVKDVLGNISIDTDSIKFEVGNIPKVTLLTAVNSANSSLVAEVNEDVTVAFNVTDVEGLHNNPLSFEYTLNNSNWYPLLDSGGTPLTLYGGLTGNPTSFNSQVTIKSPSSSYFRIRLKAADKAGNDSLVAYAAPLNTHPWLIYAGSTDSGLGNSALATSFSGQPNYGYSTFAFDPVRGDLYVKDFGSGLIKIDIKTSKSSMFLRSGATTLSLPASGAFDFNVHSLSSQYVFEFSADGWLYINAQTTSLGAQGKIYRINPETKEVQYIAGSGSDYTNLSNPAALNLMYGQLAVDESGSSYALVHCSTGATPSSTTSAFKLVKITLAGAVTHVAGDCTRASPFASGNGPYSATTSPLGIMAYPQMGDLAVKDNGNVIVHQNYSTGYLTKIINGQLYKSSLSGMGMKFHSNGKLILTSGSVRLVNIDETSSNIDTVASTIVGSDYTLPNCHQDGVAVASACAISQFRAGFTKNGQIMFADGPVVNGPRKIRIRYVNEENKVVTFAGTTSVFGEGADKSLLRGSIGSIYYQPSTLANADFPEGLYIGAPEAPAIYHIDTAGILDRHMGSGLGSGNPSPQGAVIDSSFNLGSVYTAGHSGANFKFGTDGYPYIRGSVSFFRVGPGKIGNNKMSGGISWDNLTDGSSALAGSIPAVTLKNNIALKGNGLFIAGVGVSGTTTTSGNNSSSLRFMDFTQDKVVHIMGGNGTNAYSPDQTTTTDLRGLNLNMTYGNTGIQYVQYDAANDLLYFVENSKKLRYITAPGSHASKLITILDFTSESSTIYNFTLRPDGSSIFFVRGNGKLYCHNLGTAPAWCDSVTELGPTSGLPLIGGQPNQFSWKNNNILFVSNGSVVMSYTVP